MESMEVTIQGLKKDVKSLEHRMDRMEEMSDNVSRLATSVEVMATNMEQMTYEQRRLADMQEKEDGRIRTLEMQPAEAWNNAKKTLITCALSGIGGAIVGAIISLI